MPQVKNYMQLFRDFTGPGLEHSTSKTNFFIILTNEFHLSYSEAERRFAPLAIKHEHLKHKSKNRKNVFYQKIKFRMSR